MSSSYVRQGSFCQAPALLEELAVLGRKPHCSRGFGRRRSSSLRLSEVPIEEENDNIPDPAIAVAVLAVEAVVIASHLTQAGAVEVIGKMRDRLGATRLHRTTARLVAVLDTAAILFDLVRHCRTPEAHASGDPTFECLRGVRAAFEGDDALKSAYWPFFFDPEISEHVKNLWKLWVLHSELMVPCGAAAPTEGEVAGVGDETGEREVLAKLLMQGAEGILPQLDTEEEHNKRYQAQHPAWQGGRRRHEGDKLALMTVHSKMSQAADSMYERVRDRQGHVSRVVMVEVLREYLECPTISVLVGATLIGHFLPWPLPPWETEDVEERIAVANSHCRAVLHPAIVSALQEKSRGHGLIQPNFEDVTSEWLESRIPLDTADFPLRDEINALAAESIKQCLKEFSAQTEDLAAEVCKKLKRAGEKHFLGLWAATKEILLRPIIHRAQVIFAERLMDGFLFDEKLLLGAAALRSGLPHPEVFRRAFRKGHGGGCCDGDVAAVCAVS